MSEQFIGRQTDLATIRKELDQKRHSLIIVLGRRRVGKSSLLFEAEQGRTTIHYQATKVTGSLSLQFFKEAATAVLGDDPVLLAIRDWLGALTYLERQAEKIPGLTVVLDEFPYLCDVDKSLPSVVQKFWDQVRKRPTNFNLILCGSQVSFMEEILSEKNPLHGRQTLRLDVAPLTFRDAATFFPDWSVEDKLRAYGIFGGMPYYLDLCNPANDLRTNAVDLILRKGAPLFDEANNLMQSELRDVTRYMAILTAIAEGCTKSGEVLGRIKEFSNAQALSTYFDKLRDLRFIRIVKSLDAQKDRDRRYYLNDPFLAFWFNFCLPNASALAAGHAEDVWDHRIEQNFDQYMGSIFEWICRDHASFYIKDILKVPAQEVGQIWSGEYDIDVAGTLLDGSMLYGECKWRNIPASEKMVDTLIERSTKTSYGAGKDKRHFVFYSRGGYSAGAEKRAQEADNIHLLALNDLLP